MSDAEIDSVPGPRDEPELHSRARTLLARALRYHKVDSIADELQRDPDDGANKIRDLILTRLQIMLFGSSTVAPLRGAGLEDAQALLACAMDLLEAELEAAAPAGKRKPVPCLYLTTSPGPPPLAHGSGPLIDATEGLDSALVERSWANAPLAERTGLLVALLVTRSGLCHPVLIRAVLSAVERGECIRITSEYLWIDVAVEIDRVAQKRRIFLDPATVAAMALFKEALNTRDPSSGGKANVFGPGRLIREGWQALRGSLGPPCDQFTSLGQLMDSVAARIQLDAVPLLASYAKGLVASTTWQESCWLRLLGYDIVASDDLSASAETRNGRGVNERSELSVIDRLISDPVDEDAFQRQLREATRAGDRVKATDAIQNLLGSLAPGSTKHFIAGWILHLVTDARTGKGKRLKLSTVNFFRATLASRLIAFLPERLDTLTGEDLTDLYAELVDSVRTPALKRRVSELLRRFNYFCIREGLRVNGTYELPKTSAAEADISARHVREDDYLRALKHLRHERDLAACVFLILAYRFGARRAEILGLTLLDVQKGNPDCALHIRPNNARALKTSNALRRLPLALLDEHERRDVGAFWTSRYEQAKAAVRSGRHLGPVGQRVSDGRSLCQQTYLFLDSIEPAREIDDHPAASKALEALRIATGDPEIHLHHLRHSFASRNLLGMLLGNLPHGASKWLPRAIEEMREPARKFHEGYFARVGRLARRGSMVSMALGHGSDQVTYQHYVHGLDLLVYVTRRAARHTTRQQASNASDVEPMLRQHEAAEAAVILGRSPLTKPATASIPGWIARKARSAGLNVQVFDRAAERRRPRLDVHWAKAHPEVAKLDGYPKTVLEHERASETLRLLSEGMNIALCDVKLIVETLADGTRKDGWRELPCAHATRLREASIKTFQVAPLEFRRAAYKGRVRRMVTLQGRALVRWLKEDRTVQVRFRDLGAGKDARRQRHATTISWAVNAAAAYVREFMSEAPESDAQASAPSALIPLDD
jgi:integrase